MAKHALIITHGRSGSTFLGRSLSMSPEVRWDAELLSWRRLQDAPAATIARYSRKVSEWEHNRWIVGKAMWGFSLDIRFLRTVPARFILLEREDYVKAAESAILAEKTEDWTFGWNSQKVGELLPREQNRVLRHAEKRREFYREARKLFPDALTISSEALFKDHAKVIGEVCDWLEIPMTPIPRVFRSAQHVASTQAIL